MVTIGMIVGIVLLPVGVWLIHNGVHHP